MSRTTNGATFLPEDPTPGGLETERLILRLLTEDDALLVVGLFQGDWDAVRHTGRMPWPVDEPSVRDWLRLHRGPGAHSFIVHRKSDRVAVGMAGFGGAHGSAELGYGFGRAHWGRGYASEAVRALVGHARTVGIRILDAYAFLDNPASRRVLEKAGFDRRGVIERHYPARGGVRRVHHFQVTFPREVA